MHNGRHAGQVLESPASAMAHLNGGSAALLARLEAENAILRHRATELALDIQKLAEKSG
jgi:hypothetical protein